MVQYHTPLRRQYTINYILLYNEHIMDFRQLSWLTLFNRLNFFTEVDNIYHMERVKPVSIVLFIAHLLLLCNEEIFLVLCSSNSELLVNLEDMFPCYFFSLLLPEIFSLENPFRYVKLP